MQRLLAALALAGFVVAAAAAVDAPSSSLEAHGSTAPAGTLERIEEDPVLAERLAAYETAWESWAEGAWCALLQSPRPRTRMLAAGVVDLRQEDMVCGFAGGAVDAAAVRREALAEGWDDPVVVLHVYTRHCASRKPAGWCDAEALRERLRMLDPDNAAVLLLPLTDPQDPAAVARSVGDPVEMRPGFAEILGRAAGAGRFDSYWGAGWAEAHRELRAWVEEYPPPEPDAELEAALSELSAFSGRPSEWLMTYFAAADGVYSYGFGKLIGACDAARQGGKAQAVAACDRLGVLLRESGRTRMAEMMGHALRRLLDRPEYVGGGRDAVDPARWQRQLRGVVVFCEQPRLLTDPLAAVSMPESHYAAFYEDLDELGEIEAMRRAAVREYARHPELYPVDPAACHRAWDLDEADQRALAELDLVRRSPDEKGPHGLGYESEALAALAVMLDEQARNVSGAQ